MGSLIGWAVRLRLLVVAAAVGMMVVGIVHLRSAPVDVLPEFTPPYTEIQTEALGLSADEVEQLITVPLEADLLNGVEGVDVIRSQSVPGLSSIVLVFAPGTDVYRARQLVEERLTQAHALPNVSKPPTLLQPLSSSSRLLLIGLASPSLSPIEQSVIARWTVRPRLMGVPGVANVSIWGMRDQQLQVQVDPAQLRDQGVTLGQVVRSAGNAQVVSPLSFLEASTPGTGGYVETPQQRLQVRHVLERIADPAELAKVPVEGTAGRLRLSDVATIRVDHQPLIGDAVVDGQTGLMLMVEKLPGADVREVTAGVEGALDALRPGLSGMTTDTSIFRPADYVQKALDNIRLALLVGAALLVLGAVAWWRRWRALLMGLVTLPLAYLTAALVLSLLGQGFNAIALAGLAAAVAVVVDEAVVPVERAWQRLRRGVEAGTESAGRLLAEAMSEIRRPLTYAGLVALLPVVPIALMQGRPGAFFAPLALGYALAVVAATAVAVTVGPAVGSLLLRGRPSQDVVAPSGRVAARYDAGLATLTRRPARGVLVAVALGVIGLVTLPFLDVVPVPTFKDRDVLVRLEAEPGTSNPRMAEIATQASEQLRAVSGVIDVGAHIGRAVTGDRVTNVNSSDVWVSIDADADYDATRDAIDDVVRELPVVRRDVVTYSTQELRDVGALTRGDARAAGEGLALLTGAGRPVVVRLFGQDPRVLHDEALKVKAVMAQVDGVVDPQLEPEVTQPTVEIEVDLERALQLGITPGDVRRAEATLLQGIQVGSVFQQQKVFDVIVQGAPSTRGSVDAVRALLIDRPGGGHVRLDQVADVRVVDAVPVIKRDAVSRRLDVEAGVNGRSVSDVAADIEGRLRAVDFPLEYHAEVLRGGSGSEVGTARVLGAAGACLLAAYLLMQAAFRSWRRATLAALTVPLALVGGLVVALIDDRSLTLGAMTGLLAAFALATRMVLVMVDRLQSADADDQSGPREERVRSAAEERLQPVLATTVGVGLLAVPFAVLGARPGLEVLHPMALVLLGSLLTSALVTLGVVPAAYLLTSPAERRPGEEDDDLARPVDGAARPHAATLVAEPSP